jgi:hypothetical protein
MADLSMSPAFAASESGARLLWFLDRLRDRASDLTDDALRAAWVTEAPAVAAPMRRAMLTHFGSIIGPFTVEGHEQRDDAFALAHLRDARDRAWRAWVQIETRGAHRIRQGAVTLAAPPGWTVRPAEAADATALRALERQSPIVLGDLRITYDRGADYFAGARLTGGITGVVAERDGEVVAMHCMLTHPVRVSRLQFRATYLHHSRIRRDAQGAGLFSVLNGAELERHAAESDAFYSYVAVGNDAALRIVPVPPWTIRPERVVIECRAHAGPMRGRLAGPTDAARIAELVNAAHEREELFIPYTTERLDARLARDARLYGWDHLLLGDRAVVGVWAAGIRMVRDGPAGREESVRALVLDTGFEIGAEVELVDLIRAWCGRLHALGMTHLTVFTSPGSPGRDAYHALAARVEPYHFNIGLPEPSDVATRGLYVDQLYF